MKQLLFILTLCSLVSFGAPNPIEQEKSFDEAKAAYESGNYSAAAADFEALLKSGLETSEIHYDLGDTYFREKDIGRAIFHFRKAQELAPRDPDIRYNLRFARKQAVDRIEDHDESTILSSFIAFNEKEGFWVFISFTALFWTAAIAHLFLRRKILKWGWRIGLVLALSSLSLFVIHNEIRRPFGVVVAKEASVYSGMGKESILLFTLHAGTEFRVNEDGDTQWLELQLADGKKGWIPKADVVSD